MFVFLQLSFVGTLSLFRRSLVSGTSGFIVLYKASYTFSFNICDLPLYYLTKSFNTYQVLLVEIRKLRM